MSKCSRHLGMCFESCFVGRKQSPKFVNVWLLIRWEIAVCLKVSKTRKSSIVLYTCEQESWIMWETAFMFSIFMANIDLLWLLNMIRLLQEIKVRIQIFVFLKMYKCSQATFLKVSIKTLPFSFNFWDSLLIFEISPPREKKKEKAVTLYTSFCKHHLYVTPSRCLMQVAIQQLVESHRAH